MLCIPPQINRKLRQAVESGEVKLEQLFDSEQRDLVLQKYVGKNYADNINKRFISKFNTELSDEALKDIIDTTAKVNKLRADNPIKTVEQWSKTKNPPQWAREYAALQARMEQQVNKKSTLGAFGSAKEFVKEEFRKVADQTTMVDKAVQGVKSTFNVLTSPIYKSLRASMDLSYALRQGFKVFTKSPSQWGKSMTDAFKFVKAVGSKSEMDRLMSEFKAMYYAHPNYDKLVGEGKLAFGLVEDWFPTTVAEKIPALGNIFKSSNEAFTTFSQSARFGIASDLLEKATKLKGSDLTKEELQAIGYIANSITGRGSLGKGEAISGALNKLFFSARYISSQVDTFTMPFNQKLTPFARQEALKHSRNTLGAIASIMATASFFGDVEWDWRSANFGKMKVAGSDAWIDLTAGLGSYLTLVGRQLTGETKKADGEIVKLNNTKEYKGQTRTDVAFQWFQNKLAPAPALINQAVGQGELYGNKEVNAKNIATQLLSPITTENLIDYMSNEEKATALLLFGSDMIGLGVKTPY